MRSIDMLYRYAEQEEEAERAKEGEAASEEEECEETIGRRKVEPTTTPAVDEAKTRRISKVTTPSTLTVPGQVAWQPIDEMASCEGSSYNETGEIVLDSITLYVPPPTVTVRATSKVDKARGSSEQTTTTGTTKRSRTHTTETESGMSGGMDHGHWHSGDSNDYGSDHEHVTSHENGHGAQGKEGSGNKKKGHGHGHSHEVPASVAAVAWMVIMGDGLHNFTDGMAIGVAFAGSISGGISTAVAVFCHELPHELGDFAVLLKTGMRLKEAFFFNILSSVLSFVGMLVGIAVGNIQSASLWIFAFTAGTFIYIALVDMLPELSSADVKPGESRIAHLVIQNLGLMTGVGVMLLIALFEEQIKNMLE